MYSEGPTSIIHGTHSDNEQKAIIARAVWHQFTTVVILKQNMRQKSQTPGDQKLRKCLERMRYGACTPTDIQLLRSRIVGRHLNQPKLTDPNFHYVSIITSWNAYRDKINSLRSEQFAQECNSTLQTFYSKDQWKSDTKAEPKKQRKNSRKVNPHRSNNNINPYLQDALWNLSHCCSDNHPGILRLCKGLPVMIKKNIATECCVTNGAEARVVSWISKPLDDTGKLQLETVFVELISPPKNIQLEGLPLNVVPINRTQQDIQCMMPNGKTLSIHRDQIPLVPNFAMTDYNSQGRTRAYNVVDLQNCKSNQSVYTCLSRGSTLEGTAIIQGFNDKKITSGISGWLRQEFRELEILNTVTSLHYNRKLPPTVGGIARKQIVYTYRKWKGEDFVPRGVPLEIKWSEHNTWSNADSPDEEPWHVVEYSSSKKPAKPNRKSQRAQNPELPISMFVSAKGTVALKTVSNSTKPTKKRKKPDHQDQTTSTATKKIKLDTAHPEVLPSYRSSNWGFEWSDWSCAYDSLFSILLHAAVHSEDMFISTHLDEVPLLHTLVEKYVGAIQQGYPVESARDFVRTMLHNVDSEEFPLHTAIGTEINMLCSYVLENGNDILHKQKKCKHCDFVDILPTTDNIAYNDLLLTCSKFRWQKQGFNTSTSAQRTPAEWILANLHQPSRLICPNCNNNLYTQIALYEMPLFIRLRVDDVKVHWTFLLEVQQYTYRLCGFIYYGSNHFTSRIVTADQQLWYNNGIKDGQHYKFEGPLDTFTMQQLAKAPNSRKLIIAVYVLYTKRN